MQTDSDTRDPALASPLAALRGEMAALNTPPAVASELMAAFARKQHRPRRWFQRWFQLSGARWGIAGGAACAALLAIAVAFTLAVDAPRQHADVELAAGGLDTGGDFIALASFERIEQDPAPRLVEATVPRTSLASLGVPVSPENAGDLVLAEMLIGADGRPLALRLALQ